MSKKFKTAIVGGLIALIVGIAVSYGLIDQQTGEELKTKSEEILSDDGTTTPAPAPDTTSAPAGEATTPEATSPAENAGTVDEAVTQEAPTEPAVQEPSAPATEAAPQEATPPVAETIEEPASTQ